MSLLEELDREAALRKADSDAASREKAEMQEIFHAQLMPGLDRLREFLDRLTANLKLLERKIAVRYPVPGYGEMTAYIEHDYRIEETRHPSSRTLELAFSCAIASQECPLVDVQGAARVRSLAGVFHRHRIGGMSTPQKDQAGEIVGASFRARGRIGLRAVFHVDAENPKLRMSFENIEGLGTTIKAVSSTDMHQELFDEIGRYLIGEPNALFREDLPAAYRRQLRQKVQQEQLRRHWETRVAAPPVTQVDSQSNVPRIAGAAGLMSRTGDALAGFLHASRARVSRMLSKRHAPR